MLSGVGSRAWKFNLTEDFTGLHARPTGAIFYARGEIVATMAATLPYEGAFPAPLRPQTLILPRSLAGWAHHHYTLTLRGRDALNAITGVHQNFRAQHGQGVLPFSGHWVTSFLQPSTPCARTWPCMTWSRWCRTFCVQAASASTEGQHLRPRPA
ncbi:hypothetical protein ACFSC4_02665 [Deinococcus malanensis]|uniref:hypothetical protein n=1 Tax=Deinococcus malanensis TaxID=1706855 RepID=UPI003637633B